MSVFLEPLLKALEIKHYFSKIYGPESFATHKPDPGPLRKIACLHKVPLDQMILVGDTETDIKAGKAAELQTCAVSWGYGEDTNLRALAPSMWAHSPENLIELLKNANG